MQQDFLIGRQQIFDREGQVCGYELLFRDVDGKAAAEFGPTEASNRLIVNTLLEQGLEQVVGPHRAFINFTRDNLLGDTALLLPKDKVVVEVLETVAIDEALIAAVRRLAERGYTIALDDFVFAPEWLPLIALARIVKLDIRNSTLDSNRQLVQHPACHAIEFLAEKVETHDEHRDYRDLGCQYFQGFLFSRPSIIRGRRLATDQTTALRMLAALNDSKLSIKQLADIIILDVGLSYKLLRYINSAAFSLGRTVESIPQALNLLGLSQIRHWASLILLARFPDKPKELISIALVRAKMCEALVSPRYPADTGAAFLVGLLSTMENFLSCPMAEALHNLPLAAPVREALLERRGILGSALSCVLTYEQWQMEDIQFADVPLADIGRIYLESVAWAYEAEQLAIEDGL